MGNEFNIIVTDPCWSFDDKLKMKSGIKRSADSQYSTLSTDDIINLDVKSIAAKDALIALWVPSALLKEGIMAVENYGFKLKQTFVWVKTKKNPFKNLTNNINSILGFNMGHYFRNTHEICLIGTRGRIGCFIQNKSQRTVCLDKAMKHSKKTEILQDSLDIMYPDKCTDNKGNVLNIKRIELFARRQRSGYLCLGNESPMTKEEDIKVSIEKAKNYLDIEKLYSLTNDEQQLYNLWKQI